MLGKTHARGGAIRAGKRIGIVLSVLALVSLALLAVSCKQELDSGKKVGSIQGKVFYSNGEDHRGIILTLDRTDGLRAITDSDGSRAIVAMASSKSDGSFEFNNLEPGTYTIYASSNDSVEKAVSTNVVVKGAETITAEDLKLTATGNIFGYVVLDGTRTGNIGFEVFLAGTSYAARTDDTGYFCISGVPAGKTYQLVVSKGNFISSEVAECAVTALTTADAGTKAVSSDDIDAGIGTLVWKGSFASESEINGPRRNWAYFNSTDGCSYIYDGAKWTLLAQKGDTGATGAQGEKGDKGDKGDTGATGAAGADGKDGKDGANGVSITWKGELDAAPAEPGLYWAYFDKASGNSYIFDGTDWTLLAAKGATGEKGADGADGSDGADGADGEDGSDGADGVDGLSIVWMGSYDSEEDDALAEPQELWVYFNKVEGQSYIFDGEEWTLLAAKGAQGDKGETGAAGADGKDGKDGANGVSITWKGELDAAPAEPGLYWAYFDKGTGGSFIWTGTQWDKLAIKGATGAGGSSGAGGSGGAAIEWKGSYATENDAELANPQANWAYYNTATGSSYIYDGGGWTLLAKGGKDGADGADGEDGIDGSDGASIIWKGELDAAPAEPKLLWAYFNTDSGNAYIYDGTDWTLLAAKGEKGDQGIQGETGATGATGAAGAAGADGISIIWKGELDTDPADPKLNWAYFNNGDGCSYIWNGTKWDKLAIKGATGETGATGATGPQGPQGEPGITGAHTVTFEIGENATGTTAAVVVDGMPVGRPADPKMDGYVFGGWCKDSDWKREYDFTSAITADTTIYASWRPIITVNQNYEDAPPAKTFTVGLWDVMKLNDKHLAFDLRPGYVFEGWYDDADCTIEHDFSEQVEGPVELFAKWTTGTIYRITSDSHTNEDGNRYDKFAIWWTINAVKAGDTISLSFRSTVPIEQYSVRKYDPNTYSKWFHEESGENEYPLYWSYEDTDEDGWTTVSYKFPKPTDETEADYIDYGEGGCGFVIYFRSESQAIVPGDFIEIRAASLNGVEAPTLTEDNLGSASALGCVEQTIVIVPEYYEWTSHTVTFNTAGAPAIDSVPVKFGESVEQPAAVPEKEGFVFVGWFKDAAFTKEFDFETPIVKDKTIYACFGKTVTFDSNGGSAVEAAVVPVGKMVSEPIAPTKDGGVFEGWFLGDVEYDFDTAVIDNITLVAHWNESRKLTFDLNYSGSVNPTLEVKPGEAIEVPKNPSRAGYFFGGWYLEDGSEGHEFETVFDFSSGITEATTIYAKWDAPTEAYKFTATKSSDRFQLRFYESIVEELSNIQPGDVFTLMVKFISSVSPSGYRIRTRDGEKNITGNPEKMPTPDSDGWYTITFTAPDNGGDYIGGRGIFLALFGKSNWNVDDVCLIKALAYNGIEIPIRTGSWASDSPMRLCGAYDAVCPNVEAVNPDGTPKTT